MEEKKNLCAPIPLSLHQRLRAEQEQRGQTLSDYITDILREHFEGGTRTMNANNRTIAFQVYKPPRHCYWSAFGRWKPVPPMTPGL